MTFIIDHNDLQYSAALKPLFFSIDWRMPAAAYEAARA
jgi:hypothetical protein